MGCERIRQPLSLCLQAEDQGLLQGDLNMAKVSASMLVSAYHAFEKREELASRLDIVVDVIDLYLKLNHPAAYDEVQRFRASEADAERDPNAEMLADNMAEMYERLMEMDDIL